MLEGFLDSAVDLSACPYWDHPFATGKEESVLFISADEHYDS